MSFKPTRCEVFRAKRLANNCILLASVKQVGPAETVAYLAFALAKGVAAREQGSRKSRKPS